MIQATSACGASPSRLLKKLCSVFGNVAFLAAVRQAISDGKTAEQAAAELTVPAKFNAYTMGNKQANVTAIYAEHTP